MKWTGRRESSNIDDLRSISGRKIAADRCVAGIAIYLLYTLSSGNNVDPLQTIALLPFINTIY